MRRCSNCGNQTEAGFTTDTYTRKGLDIEITLSGIPAKVCPSCGESYIDLDLLGEVELFILPFFDAAKKLKCLPTPKVTAAFPALAPAETS